IVATKPKAPAILPPPPVPDGTPRAPVDSPRPKQDVPAGRHVVAKPKESPPTTRVVAAQKPRPPAGANPLGAGLKSGLAWLHGWGLLRGVSPPASPAPHRAESNKGSGGPPPPGTIDRNAGRRPLDRPAAPEVVTPIIALPAEVKVTPGTAAKLHIR